MCFLLKIDYVLKGSFDADCPSDPKLTDDISWSAPGRVFRHGKARISAELAGIFERLGARPPLGRPAQAPRGGRWFGRIFASAATRLQEVAAKLNVPRLINLCGCPI